MLALSNPHSLLACKIPVKRGSHHGWLSVHILVNYEAFVPEQPFGIKDRQPVSRNALEIIPAPGRKDISRRMDVSDGDIPHSADLMNQNAETHLPRMQHYNAPEIHRFSVT